MIISGLIAKDSAGCLQTVAVGPVFFNGGTPTDTAGYLVVAETGGIIRHAGLLYDADTALVVAAGGTIAGFTADALPVDSSGALCVSNDGTPATWHAGVPFDSNGRICVTGMGPTPPSGDAILQEDSFYILQEDASYILQE